MVILWVVSCRNKFRVAAWASGLLFGVAAGIALEKWRRPPPPPELDAPAGEIVLLEGCVVEPPVHSEGRERFLLELGEDARVRVNLYTKEGEPSPDLRYGQRVEIEARVRKPRNFGNPGAFDYAGWLGRRNIHWAASVSSAGRVRVLPGRCGERWSGFVARVREAALGRLDALHAGNPYARGVTRALLFGDASQLERIWVEDYRRTGTWHALVISGMHLAAVTAVIVAFLRLFSLSPVWSMLVASGAGWFYALVCGGGAPVTRAAAALTLFLLARCFYRRGRILNLLAATGLAFLAADPQQLFEASCQLSYLAVALIGALALPLLERTSSPYAHGLRRIGIVELDPHLPPRVAAVRLELRLFADTARVWLALPKWITLRLSSWLLRGMLALFELVTVSAILQVGLALPMIWYFHRVSLTGISANVLVVLSTSIALPLGYLEVLTGWGLAARLTEHVLELSRWAAHWHAGWEPAWRIPHPPWWLAALLLLSLLGVAACAGRGRRLRAAALACCLALTATAVWHPFPARWARGELELSVIDVGQGDSLLVATPEGKLLLVDGGGIPVFGRRSRPDLDIGEDVVAPYLWSRSIRRLDAIAATHAHEDHVGGLPALLEEFRPAELWLPEPAGSVGWKKLRLAAAKLAIPVRERRQGEEFEWGRARWRVLSPPAGYLPAGRARNDDSLVLEAAFGRHVFLLTGDIEMRMEKRLARNGRLSRVDLLKVAHHGSRTSSTEELLAATRPVFAIISAGFENSYRFPHRETLERLAAAGSRVLRTDEAGLIQVRSDGRRLRLDTWFWEVRSAAMGPVF